MVIQNSDAAIDSSTFTSFVADPSGGTIDVEYSTLNITSTTFTNSGATNKGGCISSRETTIRISSTHFNNCSGNSLYLEQMQKVAIDSSSITNSTSDSFASIVCLNCKEFSVSSSSFTSNTASFSNSSFGGALELVSTDATYQLSNFTITDSTFDGNSAHSGGAISAIEVDMKIERSVFKNNYADFNGGAILFSCLTLQSCVFAVSYSNFTNNSAVQSGGAMYWNFNEPNLTEISSSLNSAKHGDDSASYSASLSIDPAEVVARRLDDTTLLLDGVASGQKLPTLTIRLLDSIGQSVSTDSSSTAEITASINTTLSGTTKVVSVEGIYIFDNIIVTIPPGSSTTLVFSSNAITSTDQSKVNLEIETRLCIMGEEIVSNSCIVCKPGSYSLDPINSCEDCPSEAYCYGNYSMVPRSTYWRSGVNSDNFYKCPLTKACLGSDEVEMNYKGSCLKGYQGNMCQACESGYSRTNDNECGSCPNKVLNGVRLSLIFIGAIFISSIIVRSTIKSANEPKALHSIYFKIFANYLQLIMLTAQLQLDWPQIVLSFFSIHQTAGSVAEQMFSFDCYLENDTDEASYKKVYFQKLIFLANIPALLGLLSIIAWTIICMLKRSTKDFARHVMATIVVLLFLAHPGLTKTFFGVFSCTVIDNDQWLISNLDIKCWDETHEKYSLTVALPFLLIFSLGVPTMVLLFLFKERKHIDDLRNRVCLGFLYNGYNHRHFYWEFVIVYRKIVIICLTVFLNTVSIPVQALFILLVLALSWQLQYNVKPFNSRSLNSMELRSILVAGITIYCGMFYLTKDLGEFSKICLFVVMLVANIYFLSMWTMATFYAVFIFFGSKIPFIRKYALKVDAFDDNITIHEPTAPKVLIYHEQKSCSLFETLAQKAPEMPLDVNDDTLDNIKAYFKNSLGVHSITQRCPPTSKDDVSFEFSTS